MENSKPQAGLLRGLLDSTPFANMGITPKFTDRELVVELTTEQLREMLMKNADARAKSSVSLELHEGKLTLTIRLW